MDGVTWDVIVVGAGVVGSAAAYQLAKQGFKTLLTEQVARIHGNISSRVIYINCLQSGFSSIFAVPLHMGHYGLILYFV